jgi:serine/threonine protein kinase
MILNMPNGGIAVDDFLYNNESFIFMRKINNSLIELLKNGIIPMNNANVYHSDIKDSNILVDNHDGEFVTRLIDWGLSTNYIPFKHAIFPKTWRNRPLQFNVPFSVIIFSDSFVELYTKYIKDGGSQNATDLKIFVVSYVTLWMKKRGAGHYKFINEIMLILFGHGITDVSQSSKPKIVETQITMNYITDYIVDVLLHYTNFKEDGTVDLREYLDTVFIKIVDIWGYMCVYFPLVELLSNNYSVLNNTEMKAFNMLKYMFTEYLYNPRHEPINMESFFKDLHDLGNLLHLTFSKSSDADKLSASSNIVAKGIRNNRTAKKYASTSKLVNYKTKLSFKRPPKKSSFKNPIFLTLK